jgi:hypothetical protein
VRGALDGPPWCSKPETDQHCSRYAKHSARAEDRSGRPLTWRLRRHSRRATPNVGSHKGLLPPGEPTAGEIAQHVAASGLREVYRSGPGALDRALFSLAAEGYACEGHTKLWERVYGQPTAVVEPPDPRTDDGSRAIEDEVGDFTTRGEQLISTTSPVIGQFVRALLAGATENLKASPFTDPATRRAEPPEVTRAVGMAQVLALVYGGPESPVSPEGLAAINAFAPPVPDDAEGHVDMATAMDFALAIGNHAPSIEAWRTRPSQGRSMTWSKVLSSCASG